MLGIDLMIDAVTGEIDLPGRPSGDWRADLSLVAHRTRGSVCAIPGRCPWPTGARAGAELPAGFDLDIDRITSLVGMVNDYVHSAVHRKIGWLAEARRTGMDMAEWMSAYVEPYVAQVVVSGRYPMFTRTVREAKVSRLPRPTASSTGSTTCSTASPPPSLPARTTARSSQRTRR